MGATGVAAIDRGLGGLEPGLPVVLAGPAGSGRTVLCLELVAAALERGEPAALLTAEPPTLVLRQAASLGLELEAALRDGRLALLELDPDAASTTRRHGPGLLLEALRAEAPDARLWILDPVSALCRGSFDERELRELLRTLLEGLSETAALVATADAETLEEEPAAERVLRNLCGAYVALARQPDGTRLFRVAKSRRPSPEGSELRFRIGAGGSEPTDAAAAAAGPAPAPPRERARILVVEEDRALREELAGWLGERWDVVTAGDGVAALSRVLSERPDLILLDLRMRRIPGRELLLSMRRGGVTAPVLGVSDADARASDRVGALVLGASDVVVKPLQRFVLLHRIEALLRLPREARFQVEDAHLLVPPGAHHSRCLPREEFDDRLERAVHFGRECGLDSSVVLVEAPSEAALDAFVAAADETLRAEDAVLALSGRRAALLLVATPLADATRAFERLAQRYARADGAAPTLAWRGVTADAARADSADPEDGWKSLCQQLEPWPAPAAG